MDYRMLMQHLAGPGHVQRPKLRPLGPRIWPVLHRAMVVPTAWERRRICPHTDHFPQQRAAGKSITKKTIWGWGGEGQRERQNGG